MTQDETTRLRARVAELEGRLEQVGAGQTAPRRSSWRSVASAVLLTIACVLAPLSVVSVWAATQLSDTDQYVATVAPLASDPQVQQAISDDVTAAVLDALDADQVTADLLQVLADQPNMPPRLASVLPGLAEPLNNGIEGFTRDQVENLLATPQFARLWEQVNRVAHTQVARLLEGDQTGAVTAQNDTITLNLAPIVQGVKDRLVARGFTLAENIPTVDRTFVLVRSDALTRAQSFYSLLTTLGVWLPFITLALFIGGVALAGNRRRTLARAAVGLTASMLVLGVGLALARSWYVSTTPAGILTEQAAGDVFDTLVRFLRAALRATAVLGLVVALGAFLAGPSPAATRTRATLQGGIGTARRGAEAKGWDTGAFGATVFAHRKGLRIGVLVAAGVVLAFWTRPTGLVVLGITAVSLLLLAAVEFLGAPPSPRAAEAPVPADGSGPTGENPVPRQAQRHPDAASPATEETARPAQQPSSRQGGQG